jgi:uncharacterized protein (TIGR03118 family)
MASLIPRKRRNTRSSARLELERLEDRWLPSAGYNELNLTGYQPGMGRYTDPNLNGWGMAETPGGSFCVANTSTGTATFYDHQGNPSSLVITIPPAPSQPFGPIGSPTGVVYNPTAQFVISANGKSAPALFLFDTLDGTISGWNPSVDPTHAVIVIDNSQEAPFPASYTALLTDHNSKGQNVLYAADGGNDPVHTNNRIDMFGGQFQSLGSFTDPNVNVPGSPYAGNTAFQVEDVKGRLFVTFGGFSAPFGGVVDVFDTDGNLLTPNHFAANAPGMGPLVNPWGIAEAPGDFGKFSHDLLIGNVEDGRINAFNPNTGKFLGTLSQPDGTPIVIPGLWDFTFSTSGSEEDDKANKLYFTAGFSAQNPAGNGLFGVITATQQDEKDQGGDHPDRARSNSGRTPAHSGITLPKPPSASGLSDFSAGKMKTMASTSPSWELYNRRERVRSLDLVFADLGGVVI